MNTFSNGFEVTRVGNTQRYVKRLTDVNGNYVGTISYTKGSGSKRSIRRKLANYSFKSISSKVLRAKSYAEAVRASGSIRQKVSELRKKMKSENCDEEEIRRALMHAQLIQKACEKKKKHLKMEEDARAELRQGATGRVKPAIVSGYGNLSIEEFIELQRKHRSDEEKDVADADMKYLRSLFAKHRAERERSAHESRGAQRPNAVVSIGGVETEAPPPEPLPAEVGEVIDEAL